MSNGPCPKCGGTLARERDPAGFWWIVCRQCGYRTWYNDPEPSVTGYRVTAVAGLADGPVKPDVRAQESMDASKALTSVLLCYNILVVTAARDGVAS